jgi:hypothetical protein
MMLASCIFYDKEEHLYLSAHLKKIADFKEGTYWIYHNDSLDINDTLTITENRKKQAKDQVDSYTYDLEEIYITLQSTYWNCAITDMLIRGIETNDYTRSYPKNTGMEGFGYSFRLRDNADIQSYYGTVKYLDNYNFENNTLNHVIYFCDTGGQIITGSEYYFAENYGLIKMKLINDSISSEWNLIDYHLIK